jgi:hypothetical protein
LNEEFSHVHDVGSPLFGSSKPRERGSSPVLLARGRRDSDGLISFNLLPVETEDGVVPGRVSDTRLMLVHYWRRDRQAEVEAAAAIDAAPPLQELIPASEIYVNGAPVLPPHVPEPASTQPTRPDLLTALKSSGHIALPASDLSSGVNGTARDAASASSTLFVEPGNQETPPPARQAPSIFERRPREVADAPPPPPAESLLVKTPVPSEPAPSKRSSALSVQDRLADIVRRSEGALVEEPVETAQAKDHESVWAKFRASVDAVSRGEPHQFDPSLLLEPEPAEPPAAAARTSEPLDTHHPTSLRALEAFLRRVEIRRQQIESQSVA